MSSVRFGLRMSVANFSASPRNASPLRSTCFSRPAGSGAMLSPSTALVRVWSSLLRRALGWRYADRAGATASSVPSSRTGPDRAAIVMTTRPGR